MAKQSQTEKDILLAVHETAFDLYGAGFIDKKKMLKYDALCLEAVPTYDANQVRALRDRYKLSQSVFASLLNTSPSTIKKWEVGEKNPSGPSRKLLNILERKGLEALL
jgi:putative transcriptional regulator